MKKISWLLLLLLLITCGAVPRTTSGVSCRQYTCTIPPGETLVLVDINTKSRGFWQIMNTGTGYRLVDELGEAHERTIDTEVKLLFAPITIIPSEKLTVNYDPPLQVQ